MSEMNGAETPKAALIDQIVSDSFKANATPTARPASIGRPIRAGGRPRKGGAPNRATLALINAEFEEAKASPPPQSENIHTATGGPESSAFDEAPPLKADDIPDVALAAVLDVPFMVLRSSTGFDGYKLDEKQSAELTPLLKAVLEIYLPNIPSKHAPAIILAGTLGTIIFKQYGEHQAFLRATHVNASVAPAHDPDGVPTRPVFS